MEQCIPFFKTCLFATLNFKMHQEIVQNCNQTYLLVHFLIEGGNRQVATNTKNIQRFFLLVKGSCPMNYVQTNIHFSCMHQNHHLTSHKQHA